jgi:hypothetical protein
VLEVIAERGVGDATVAELIIRHEHQHNETMLQTLQLAHLDGFCRGRGGSTNGSGPSVNGRPRQADGRPAQRLTGLELIEIPGGECTLGAGPEGFAYDNERRPRLPDRPYADNQRQLPDFCGGGWLRAARMVVRRGLVLEGGLRHHPTRGVDG